MDKFLCLIAEQTRGIPYHITLNTYSPEYEDYLKELLGRIGENHRQIHVVYSGLGLFGLNVLFLNPMMNMELLKIYDFTKDKSNSPCDAFSAHTTLLIDEPANILRILPRFVERTGKTAGDVKYVSLYDFFPARLIKRMELRPS